MAQLIAKPARRPTRARFAARPSRPAEQMLRDVAFVLHLTARTKREILLAQPPRPTTVGA